MTIPEGNPVQDQEVEQKPDFAIDDDTHEWLIKHLFDRCENLQSSEWLDIKRQMIRAQNYFDGRFYGYVNKQLQWVDYPKNPGEITYSAPVYQAHIQTALMEISKGTTELSFSHVSGDSRKGSLIAKMAEARYKAHRRKLFPAIKLQQENLSLLLRNIAIRYTFVKDCHPEKRPVFDEKTLQGDSVTVCAECQSPSEGECPHCGSKELAPVEAPGMGMSSISGYEQAALKESDWVSLDPIGCSFYLHATGIRETPYFIWKQALLREAVQSKYPDFKIKEGITSPELLYKQYGETSTPGSGLLTADSDGKCEIWQGWFDVELYGHFVPKKEMRMRDGTVVPAGRPLKETYPKGLFIARDQKKIIDIRGEDKNEKLAIAPYVTRLGTMVGAGTTAALDDQDLKNDLRNLHMQSIFNDAFRKEIVDATYLDPENIPNSPTERAVLHLAPQGGRIVGSAIDVLPPSPLSADAYAIEDRFDAEMQLNLGTFAGNGQGLADMKAVQDTAAGMQMWREMTVGRFFPMLAVRADRGLRRRGVTGVFELRSQGRIDNRSGTGILHAGLPVAENIGTHRLRGVHGHFGRGRDT